MSDIQRYTQTDIAELEFPGADEEGFDSVKFVMYADHVAALRACERRVEIEQMEHMLSHKNEWIADGIKAARDAVAALMPRFTQDNGWLMGQEIGAALDAALAAIDALNYSGNRTNEGDQSDTFPSNV